jgi:hypothetical protein
MEGASRQPISPRELQALLAEERKGDPFLVYRGADGSQLIFPLADHHARVTIGRSPQADVTLEGDEQISRQHAELAVIGDAWAVVDDGLSINGTFVNGRRLNGRQRLIDRDTLRLGHTEVSFRHPGQEPVATTVAASDVPRALDLSSTQRRVLIALCRPYKQSDRFAIPATNQQIAAEVFLSVDAVKKHLRALYRRHGLDHLPQNEKRAKLAELALQSGLVTHREL